ncbi:UNVERIFIED_CONTAM: hypothetical protein HDU68_011524 [Siphonaria sp. JEL0065]|nr:hypothetical protein HDU68_011524 [Siphonaria sp. JEL0065]
MSRFALFALATVALAQTTVDLAATETDPTVPPTDIPGDSSSGIDPLSQMGAVLEVLPLCGQDCIGQMYPAIIAGASSGASQQELADLFITSVCNDANFGTMYPSCYKAGCSTPSDVSKSAALTPVIPQVCAQLATSNVTSSATASRSSASIAASATSKAVAATTANAVSVVTAATNSPSVSFAGSSLLAVGCAFVAALLL